MQLTAYGITDIGCVRKNNEDAFLVRKDMPLFVVADGVGGAAAGEIASQLFVSSSEYEFEAYSGNSFDADVLMARCFQNGNRKILDHVERFPETRGMACTAEVLTFGKNQYIIGHVGDSRTYLVRDGGIEQLTKDHSYIQEQMDLGLLAPEEAQQHWLRSAIYRAVGLEEEVEMDRYNGRAKNGDIFLLCSDGLSDLLGKEDLLSIIGNSGSLQDSLQGLIDEAKARGGKDNITAILCKVNKTSIVETIVAFFRGFR